MREVDKGNGWEAEERGMGSGNQGGLRQRDSREGGGEIEERGRGVETDAVEGGWGDGRPETRQISLTRFLVAHSCIRL